MSKNGCNVNYGTFLLEQYTGVIGSVADPGFYPGSDFIPSRITDPNCFHPGSWIRIKELKYFNPKKWFLSSRKYDPNCLSRIRILTFYPSRIQGSKRHPIPDPGSGSATLVIGQPRGSQRTEMSSLNKRTCNAGNWRCGEANSTGLPTANMNPWKNLRHNAPDPLYTRFLQLFCTANGKVLMQINAPANFQKCLF
jgi:hypothetical protein